MNSKALTRRHLDGNQAQLSKEERILRLNDVFSVSLKSQALIKNKCIVIVDDVMTTGTTLNTISKLLKTYGALQVINWVILRTPLK